MKKTIEIEDSLLEWIEAFTEKLTLSEFINICIQEYLSQHKAEAEALKNKLSKNKKRDSDLW